MDIDDILGWARRHLRLLLCFALLLPAAQIAGAVHLLSHVGTAAQQDARGQHALELGSCPICPLAMAVSVGGAPSAVPVAPAADAQHFAVDTTIPGRASIAPRRLFDSRAPPSLLH